MNTVTFADTTLTEIPLDSERANQIMQIFYKSTGTSSMEEFQRAENMLVCKIAVVENKYWSQHWNVSLEKWMKKGYGTQTFIHGTKAQHVESLMEHGPSLIFSQRSAIGTGFYVTDNFREANTYGSVFVGYEACLGKHGVGKGFREESPLIHGYDAVSKDDMCCIANPPDQMLTKFVVWTKCKPCDLRALVAGFVATSDGEKPARKKQKTRK